MGGGGEEGLNPKRGALGPGRCPGTLHALRPSLRLRRLLDVTVDEAARAEVLEHKRYGSDDEERVGEVERPVAFQEGKQVAAADKLHRDHESRACAKTPRRAG